jgi:hypothetical protein
MSSLKLLINVCVPAHVTSAGRHAGASPLLAMLQGLNPPASAFGLRPTSESPRPPLGGAPCPHVEAVHPSSHDRPMSVSPRRGVTRRRSPGNTPPRPARQPVVPPIMGPARPPLSGQEGGEEAHLGDPEWPIVGTEGTNLIVELSCRAVLRLRLGGRLDQTKINLVL